MKKKAISQNMLQQNITRLLDSVRDLVSVKIDGAVIYPNLNSNQHFMNFL